MPAMNITSQSAFPEQLSQWMFPLNVPIELVGQLLAYAFTDAH